ncbi:MAG: hypothetical protein ACRYG5_10770 [Janthinobacterium lividum]
MKAYLHRCLPAQCHTCELKRGSTLVAVEGPLRVQYHDGSTDCLPDGAACRAVVIDEGACLMLPCRAFVDIRAAGPSAATVWVEPAQPWVSGAAAVGRLVQSLGRILTVRAAAHGWRRLHDR